MSAPLTLVRLRPDRAAFAAWAAERKLAPATADTGYAWHALLASALGELAPKPFVDRSAAGADELLGYVQATPDAVIGCSRRAAGGEQPAHAAGLHAIQAKALPARWQAGRTLGFEVRARPIVRSRTGSRTGRVDEIDVAPWRAAREPGIDRDRAYLDWLRTEVGRAGGAELLAARVHAFSRTSVLRRPHQDGHRRPATIEGPDVWFRGTLRISDATAFDALLRRGVGRHRAFGFGCLLLAPPEMVDLC